MAQPPRMQPDSRRECAICHLQWVDAFAQRGAVVLVEPPGDLAVSQPATCLGCHDGSVTDKGQFIASYI
ncbi:MAG: hypothetical protein ACE5K7_02985, partial [Phycisphaerae bacterium]